MFAPDVATVVVVVGGTVAVVCDEVVDVASPDDDDVVVDGDPLNIGHAFAGVDQGCQRLANRANWLKLNVEVSIDSRFVR